jgi:hypothetical protein
MISRQTQMLKSTLLLTLQACGTKRNKRKILGARSPTMATTHQTLCPPISSGLLG